MIWEEAPLSLEVYLLGLIDFDEMQNLQRRLVYEIGESEAVGKLVLCEHPPTISIGRSGSRAHINADEDELRRFGIQVRWLNRGGGPVLHLPGQLNGYLSLDVGRLGIDVGDYLRRIQQAMINVLAEFDLNGTIKPGSSGIYLRNARVASIGVAMMRWIAYHGFVLNVGPYLEPFRILQEPGPDGAFVRQTSMEAQRNRPAPMSRVREATIRQFEHAFGLSNNHLFTDHSMLRRKVPSHVYAPSLG